MRYGFTLLFLGFIATVNAHFQLQFPPPRGFFVESSEPTFCDGYKAATTNRTLFPLGNAFFSLNSEHVMWTAAVFVSTTPNPATFNDFNQVKPFFQLTGEGGFCIPLDLSANANGSSLTDGQNVTLEIVFDGGDGVLYQESPSPQLEKSKPFTSICI